MLKERKITRVALFLVVIFTPLALAIATSTVYGQVSKQVNKKKVGEISSQIKLPQNCAVENVTKKWIPESGRSVYNSDLDYKCKKTTALQAIGQIQQNLTQIGQDTLLYSKLDNQGSNSKIQGVFHYVNRDDEDLVASFELIDTAGKTITATDRKELYKIKVDSIKVTVAR